PRRRAPTRSRRRSHRPRRAATPSPDERSDIRGLSGRAVYPLVVFALDTLGYAKHLREKGVPIDQAEAHAEAARDFIMAELVTKTDLEAALDRVTLRMKVRFGGMLVTGIGDLTALLQFS